MPPQPTRHMLRRSTSWGSCISRSTKYPRRALLSSGPSNWPWRSASANDYGWFLCQSGRETEAFKYFRSGGKEPLYKTPTRPYTNAGLCYLKVKDEKSAEANFQRAVMLDGSNAQAIFLLSSLYYQRGDFINAKKLLSDLHRLIEPNAGSLWLGVRIERKLGDRQAEANYSSQLRRKFAGTPEHQALLEGKYE
ncbi:MAG: hypothetical protein M5R42_08625 [Rhodocyclaceae bacterium]|nr:hypothetical protein [Rhodocyclaceae bacterium]